MIDDAECQLDPHSRNYTQSIRVDVDDADSNIYIDAEITFITNYYDEFGERKVNADIYSVFIYKGIIYDENGKETNIDWSNIDWSTKNVIY